MGEGRGSALAGSGTAGQGSGGLTGLSVALCVSIASRRPAYLVANMARTALHLPFLAHGTQRCYARGCTNCPLASRSSSRRYVEQRLKPLFSPVADVPTNEAFKKKNHTATSALRRPLSPRAASPAAMGLSGTHALRRPLEKLSPFSPLTLNLFRAEEKPYVRNSHDKPKGRRDCSLPRRSTCMVRA